jgi:hypothetical protein
LDANLRVIATTMGEIDGCCSTQRAARRVTLQPGFAATPN